MGRDPNRMFRSRRRAEDKKPPDRRKSDDEIRRGIDEQLAEEARRQDLDRERQRDGFLQVAVAWAKALDDCRDIDTALDLSIQFKRSARLDFGAAYSRGIDLIDRQIEEVDSALADAHLRSDFFREMTNAGIIPLDVEAEERAGELVGKLLEADLRDRGVEAWAVAFETGDYSIIARQQFIRKGG